MLDRRAQPVAGVVVGQDNREDWSIDEGSLRQIKGLCATGYIRFGTQLDTGECLRHQSSFS